MTLQELLRKYSSNNVSKRDNKYLPNFEFGCNDLLEAMPDFLQFIRVNKMWNIHIHHSDSVRGGTFWILSIYDS